MTIEPQQQIVYQMPSLLQLFPVSRGRMYLIFAVVNLFSAIPRYFLGPSRGILFHGSLYLASVAWIIITWEFIVVTGRLMEKRLPAASNFLVRMIIQIILTYPVVTILGDAMFKAASVIFKIPLDPNLVTIGYLLYFLTTLVLNLVYFGIIYFFNWKKDLINLGGAQREQAIIKYDSLRNQLNPHFLFNALSSLNSLIFENQQLASDFLQQLSKVYRYVLQNKDKQTVTLSTEVNFIAHYISLLKIRFATAIDFRISLNEETLEKKIVPVTLQILIENAVKHNLVSPQTPLNIFISADETFLFVENSVRRKAQVETSNGQGLKNLKGFYEYLSEAPIQVIESENLFIVKIPLI
jgi:two-component system, LytTR family, sensor kinase